MTLRVAPNHTVTFLDVPLPPGVTGYVTALLYKLHGHQFRVTVARVIAEFPKPWIGRLLRKIPGVSRLFARRDARERDRASAQMKINYVAVDNYQCALDEIDRLPVAREGQEVRVKVINEGDRPIVARVVVEGIRW